MAAPRIRAVEIIVEMDDGTRGVTRIENPQINHFDRGEPAGVHVSDDDGFRRIRFDVEGRTTSAGPHYRGREAARERAR